MNDDPWERLVALERENEKLKAWYERVRTENEKIQIENTELTAENHNLKLASGLIQAEPGEKPGLETELSDEASRKRLERICKRNSQGFLGFFKWDYFGMFGVGKAPNFNSRSLPSSR